MMRAIRGGDVPLKIEALTDSYSIFSYLAAQHLKLPAEKGTFYHLAYLREKLVSGIVRSYSWTDTRDMVADGLTKGIADRSALAAMMDGVYHLQHAVHEFREPTTTTTPAATTAAAATTTMLSPTPGSYWEDALFMKGAGIINVYGGVGESCGFSHSSACNVVAVMGSRSDTASQPGHNESNADDHDNHKEEKA